MIVSPHHPRVENTQGDDHDPDDTHPPLGGFLDPEHAQNRTRPSTNPVPTTKTWTTQTCIERVTDGVVGLRCRIAMENDPEGHGPNPPPMVGADGEG